MSKQNYGHAKDLQIRALCCRWQMLKTMLWLGFFRCYEQHAHAAGYVHRIDDSCLAQLAGTHFFSSLAAHVYLCSPRLHLAPVPHESISNLLAKPAFSTTLLNIASAVGLRQILPGGRKSREKHTGKEAARKVAHSFGLLVMCCPCVAAGNCAWVPTQICCCCVV
jgi:hypothetical protein